MSEDKKTDKAINAFVDWQKTVWTEKADCLTSELQKHVANGNLPYVKELIKHHDRWYGPFINKPDINKDILSEAIRHKQQEMITLLFKKDLDINKNLISAFLATAEVGDLDTLKTLQEKSPYFDRIKDTLLNIAINNNQPEFVEYTLKNGANPSHKINENIFDAIENNNTTIIDLLLKNKLNIDINSGYKGSPLQFASKRGQKEMVKFLIERNADVNIDGDKALILAAKEGHLDIVEILIDNKANVNAQNDKALLYAANNKHIEVVNLLIEKGANIDNAITLSRVPSTRQTYNVAKDLLQKVKNKVKDGWYLVGEPQEQKIIKLTHSVKSKTTLSTIFNFKSEKVISQLEVNNKVSQSSENFSDYKIQTEIDEAKAEYTRQVTIIAKKSASLPSQK